MNGIFVLNGQTMKRLFLTALLMAFGCRPLLADNVVLYSTAFSEQYPNSLITVDPASGMQHLAGTPGQAADLNWLTAANNILYGTGLLSSSGRDESTLYTINPQSGAISGTVTLSQNVGAIAASANGTLYGLSGNTLGTINTATGQFSSVGMLSLTSGYFLEAIAFSPGGTLYGVTVTDRPAFDQQLITLDPATGATASDLGSLTSGYNVEDMTYAADGYIYASNFSAALIKIDPQTLSNTFVGFGDIGDPDGIAAISVPTSVPEPNTLSLIGIASVGLLIEALKKTGFIGSHALFRGDPKL